ncbi:hypothetical protein NDU88_000369 [Pleurodeles waltl]|uniref:Uncharacterized protein n=1 Tax=Pleurodeles waltl TaxID=8319 RepID=A0AAV7WFB0_PLEWA|nr:hypothetical protein NDU88_000369 [Pleurodeles waltl]
MPRNAAALLSEHNTKGFMISGFATAAYDFKMGEKGADKAGLIQKQHIPSTELHRPSLMQGAATATAYCVPCGVTSESRAGLRNRKLERRSALCTSDARLPFPSIALPVLVGNAQRCASPATSTPWRGPVPALPAHCTPRPSLGQSKYIQLTGLVYLTGGNCGHCRCTNLAAAVVALCVESCCGS